MPIVGLLRIKQTFTSHLQYESLCISLLPMDPDKPFSATTTLTKRMLTSNTAPNGAVTRHDVWYHQQPGQVSTLSIVLPNGTAAPNPELKQHSEEHRNWVLKVNSD